MTFKEYLKKARRLFMNLELEYLRKMKEHTLLIANVHLEMSNI